MALSAVLAARAPQPDVLVANDAMAMAVPGPGDKLAIMRQGGDAFTVQHWLSADGDARPPADPALREGFTCDAAGYIARLADGRIVSYVLSPEAFEEDSGRAALVVTAREAPPRCEATIVDRKLTRSVGALSFVRDGERWDMTTARPPSQDRPWARARAAPAETAQPATRPQPRDATPRMEDLEPGD